MVNQTLHTLVNEHYGNEGLLDRILAAALDAGIVLNEARSSDFSSVSEFHIGGRGATIELATMAQLRTGDKVLDIGSGLGGPARTLAEEFGAIVEGVDLTHEFCVVANELTRMTGLTEKAKFFQGDALNLPGEPNSYDVVWTQQSCMNIDDKDRMLSEAFRVLKPGGTYVFQEVLAGAQGSAIQFPVPWARETNMSFLWAPEAIRNSILNCGFIEQIWKNATSQYMEEYRALAKNTSDVLKRPIMGVHLMLGGQSSVMRQNVVENIDQGLIAVYQGVFKKL
ncbi:MAG: class I SAM-dependent methyltransferase [Proteobacteria bacterium]|nr:class I SAM-dependent methyltransferase [Pseudomonadota bacterium]